MQVIQLELDKIDQNENSRMTYKEPEIQELMGSMKQDGLLQPVGVRKAEKGRYEAVWGNRRIIAAKKLGWATVPAHVVEAENETDRDVLNMVENFKRTNTTAADDGRMFLMLKDRGLTEGEIAARLGVSKARIRMAIEVYQKIPKDYHKKVVNRLSGRNKVGTIAASAAKRVLHLKQKNHLGDSDTRKLLDLASEPHISSDHLANLAPLLKQGFSTKVATEMIKKYRAVRVTVLMEKRVIAKLQKKYGEPISEIVFSHICKNKEFRVARRSSQGRYVKAEDELEEEVA